MRTLPSLFPLHILLSRGMRRSWLRHSPTSRMVAGLIPDGVTRIFHRHNPSSRTIALGLTQPLTEIFPGGKGGRCVGLTTLPPLCTD